MSNVRVIIVGFCIAAWLAMLFLIMRLLYAEVMPAEFVPFDQRVGYNVFLVLVYALLAGVVAAMSIFLSFVFPKWRRWLFAVAVMSILEIVALYWLNDFHSCVPRSSAHQAPTDS